MSINSFGSKKFIHRKRKRMLRVRFETDDFGMFTARLADLTGVVFWQGKYQSIGRAIKLAGAVWHKLSQMSPKQMDAYIVPHGRPLTVSKEDLAKFAEWHATPEIKRKPPRGEHRGGSGDIADDESAELSSQAIPEKDLANGQAKG